MTKFGKATKSSKQISTRSSLALSSVDENKTFPARNTTTSRSAAIALRPKLKLEKQLAKVTSGPRSAPHSSSYAGSVRSNVSSARSRKRKHDARTSITDLPSEILDQIFSNLSQLELHSLLRSNRHFVEAAVIALYDRPLFASTYRLAQFGAFISRSPYHANLVRRIDLSDFGRRDAVPQAGWREWKYRDHPLYSLKQPVQPRLGPATCSSSTSSNPLFSPWSFRRHTQIPTQPPRSRLRVASPQPARVTTHPEPVPFLEASSLSRDIPYGLLLRLLFSCQSLTHLNISFLSLAPDYEIAAMKDERTFVSDVPKCWTWDFSEIIAVSGADVVAAILALKRLTKVEVEQGFWLNTRLVKTLVEDAEGPLKRLNLKGSGMGGTLSWAIEGSREEIMAIVRDVPRDS